MAFSQANLDALEAAIASGTLEVRMGDRLVRYQDMAGLIQARDLVRDQLNTATPTDRSTAASFYRD